MESRHQLTDLQLDVMRVLWNRGEATVIEVHAALEDQRGLATTTVATLLSRLEKRELIKHRTDGRQYVYSAIVSEQDVKRHMLVEITDRLFRGDVAAMMNQLISEREFSAGDLARVKALIEQKESENGKQD